MTATSIRKEAIPNANLFASMMGTQGLAWPKPEESNAAMPWSNVDLLCAQRKAVVKAFAAAVLGMDHVEGVWLRDVIDGLEVCVVVSEVDLAFDLSIREKFIELASEQLSPGEGDLFVYHREVAPDWVFQGTPVTA